MEENPFDYHRPVEPERFLDRVQQRADLERLLSDGRNVLVYGPRRRGKTSLVLYVLSRLDSVGIYVDATRMQSPGDLGAKVLKQLAGTGLARGKRFRKWLVDKADGLAVDVTVGKAGVTFTLRRDHAHHEALLDALEFLEEVGRGHDARFTVCLDEFQVVMEDPGLVAALRSVVQHQRRVNYVLSGSEPSVLQALNQDRQSPFYKQLTEFAVQGITIRDMQDDVEAIFGERFTQDAIDLLHESVGDNTLRLVQVLRHAYGMGQGLGPDAVRDAVDAAVLENGTEYERILSLVKPGNQRTVLFALAQDRPEHITGTAFLKRHAFGTPSHVKRAVTALQRLEVLGEDYRFLDPLFPLYLTA